jgi:cation transport ATPase
MKKVMIVIPVILLVYLSINAVAWNDCPFGLVDEPYPGTCPRYIDTNIDGICDHSQSEFTEEIQENSTENENQTKQESSLNLSKFPIMLLISFILIIILIIFLRYLKKIKKLSNLKEKIIWNILLLIFFLPSAITGVILLLSTNLGILRELGMSFLQIHDITSLFFMWISAYHILWHSKYYLKSLNNLTKK